jgi:hypothetical protein
VFPKTLVGWDTRTTKFMVLGKPALIWINMAENKNFPTFDRSLLYRIEIKSVNGLWIT